MPFLKKKNDFRPPYRQGKKLLARKSNPEAASSKFKEERIPKMERKAPVPVFKKSEKRKTLIKKISSPTEQPSPVVIEEMQPKKKEAPMY